jgi:uncharacterized cupin superfamily protein
MPSSYSRVNLNDVDDAAPANGFGERWQARVAGGDLAAEQTGIAHFRLHPGRRSPFVHRHDEAEEIYLVLTGSGTMRLDGDLLEVSPLDAIRVAPGVARGFEAGAEGLEFVAVGPHVTGDGQLVDDGWAQDG